MNEYLQKLEPFKANYPDQLNLGEYEPAYAFHLKYLYSWAIPNDEAIAYLISHSPIVEIGAGTGYWAYLIKKAGGEIIAYDIQPYHNHWCTSEWSEVLVGDESVLTEYPNHTLFLCWPPINSPMAYNALSNYAGKRLIYIGEGKYGATADDDFFDLIKEDWKIEIKISIPRLVGTHDKLISYTRKQANQRI